MAAAAPAAPAAPAEVVFTFTVTEKPENNKLVKYYQEIEGNRLDVTYETVSHDEFNIIKSINVYMPLEPDAVVPTASGSTGSRGLLREKSLQIPYTLDMGGDCKNKYGRKILPTIYVGQTATIILKGLDKTDVTNLRISSCELIIGESVYIVTPIRYTDNRITDATCTILGPRVSGGKRKTFKKLRKRKSIKKLRKQSYRRRR